ncbi:MAG: hypothetical protein E7158_02620 [Firmicutes bacterium]|nr:hypothetical protein [Bacillota bacterium]
MNNEKSKVVNQNVTYKLTLNRKKSFVGCLIGFDIYIDNKKVTKIKNGQTVEISVPAGNHLISVNNKNTVNILFNDNITADVVVFGSNDFGITNISGQNSNAVEITSNNIHLDENKKKTDILLIFSIIMPILSIVLIYEFNLYIKAWVYGLFIGYTIVTIAGLKNDKNSLEYKSLLLKNIIAAIIYGISAILTVFLSVI